MRGGKDKRSPSRMKFKALQSELAAYKQRSEDLEAQLTSLEKSREEESRESSID